MKLTFITIFTIILIVSVLADSKSSEEKKQKKRMKQLKKIYKDRVKYEKLLNKVGKKYGGRLPLDLGVEREKIHHIHHINEGVTRPVYIPQRPPYKIPNQNIYIELDQRPPHHHQQDGFIHVQQQQQHGGQLGQHGMLGENGEMIVTSKVTQQYVPGGGVLHPGHGSNDMVLLLNPNEQIGLKQQQHIVGQWDGIESLHTLGGGHGGSNTMEFIEIHKTADGKTIPGTQVTEIYKTIGGRGHHHGGVGATSVGGNMKQWELVPVQHNKEIKKVYFQTGQTM